MAQACKCSIASGVAFSRFPRMSSAPLTAHGSQPSDAPPVCVGSQPEKFGSQPAVVADDDITDGDRKDGEDEPSQSRASPVGPDWQDNEEEYITKGAGGAEVWQQIQRKMNDDFYKALPKLSSQQMYGREKAKLARIDAQRQKAKLARLDAWMLERRVQQLVEDAENPDVIIID